MKPMKKRQLVICGSLILTAVIFLGVVNAIGENAKSTKTVIDEPVSTSEPDKTAEPAQNTEESGVQEEPMQQGKRVQIDDEKYEEVMNELNEYIDDQIGGN